MSLEQLAYLAEIIGVVAVVGSLIFVGIQIRSSNRVNSANARHQISAFALELSKFHAEHADRLAKVSEETDLSVSDELFRWWCHMQVMLHAETYYHHYELGLMPAGHWKGYVHFVTGYAASRGMKEFWDDVGPAFSKNFSDWMTEIVDRENAATAG